MAIPLYSKELKLRTYWYKKDKRVRILGENSETQKKDLKSNGYIQVEDKYSLTPVSQPKSKTKPKKKTTKKKK